MSYNNLEKLANLLEKGLITQEEFNREKNKIFASTNPVEVRAGALDLGTDKTYCIIMHIGQFCPGLGGFLSIIMWLIKKNESKAINLHGKIITNWLLSCLVYLVVGAVLTLVFVGAFLIIAVVVMAIVYPIIGAVKASNGETWRYPMSINFFNIDELKNQKGKAYNDDLLDA